MNLIIVVTILAGFSWWELLLLLSYAFLPRHMVKKIALVLEDKAIDLIFAMFFAFRGFKINFKNLAGKLPDRFIIIANHQSLLDIPILMHLMPQGVRARFIAKQELAWGVPLISMLLRTAGHCLVRRRGDALQAMRSVTAMAKRCRVDGTIPAVFPEGTRSRTGELGVFHSAGFRKILEVDALPILVAAVDGGREVAKLKGFFANFGKTPYSTTFLGILPPPTNKKEALAALETSRKMIGDYLGR